jgi:3-oxoisoapionate decarboxylase
MTTLSRRAFAKTISAGAAVAAAGLAPAIRAAASARIKLGIDNFAVRAFGWNADELIDYAASLRTDSLFISDLKPFRSHSADYLKDIRAKASDKGLQIHLGSWSICPTSKTFRKDWGTAEEHLSLGIQMARALGSPVFRVVLGNGEDRKTPGGIEARIADTVKVLKACRSKALDAGVKIAVENHAGDLLSWELASLVEQAGKDYVGVNMDSGNAVWTLEDPLESLEILGPLAVTTSLRDAVIWEYADGAKVQWTAMGDGMIDWKTYFARFAELCPGVPVHIETISGFAREFPYLKKEFWIPLASARGKDFARFVALAKKGKPIEPFKAPDGVDKKEAEKNYQKAEVERSIRYCKEVLGLGLEARSSD